MHLIFYLDEQPYALTSNAVKELFKLPKLTPVATISSLAGTLNCRGKVIAVLDFSALLGRPRPAYCQDDVLIVLEHLGQVMGLIVSEVAGLRSFSPHDIVPLPKPLPDIPSTLVMGQYVGGDEELITVMDVDALFAHPAALQAEPSAEVMTSLVDARFDWQQFDADARALLTERASRIARVDEPADPTGTEMLAIVSLAGERFALRTGPIQEFTLALRVQPLPSCPPHIAGCMNLRGDALVLVDVRGTLHLSTDGMPPMVVVMRVPGLGLFGVLVDAIEQVASLRIHDPDILPGGLARFEESYLCGLLQLGGVDVPLLDVAGMLFEAGMIADMAA
ncbi:MAG: hypothetical protein RL404_1055 [Pseudomonadota bacterium]